MPHGCISDRFLAHRSIRPNHELAAVFRGSLRPHWLVRILQGECIWQWVQVFSAVILCSIPLDAVVPCQDAWGRKPTSNTRGGWNIYVESLKTYYHLSLATCCLTTVTIPTACFDKPDAELCVHLQRHQRPAPRVHPPISPNPLFETNCALVPAGANSYGPRLLTQYSKATGVWRYWRRILRVDVAYHAVYTGLYYLTIHVCETGTGALFRRLPAVASSDSEKS